MSSFMNINLFLFSYFIASEEKPQFQWQRPTVIGNAPTGRHGNTATLVGNEMFVIGGCENDITCFSDISLYNTDSHRWEVIYSDREHARISPLNREKDRKSVV